MSSATTPEQVHALFLDVLDQVDPTAVLAQVGHDGPRTEAEFVEGLRAGDERARLVMVERLPRAGFRAALPIAQLTESLEPF